MGFLANLFSLSPPQEQPPILTSIYPAAAAAKLTAGVLPIIKQDKLILRRGEECRFVDCAALVTEKKHYERRSHGQSVRIMKGLTWHTGESANVLVVEPHYTKGILYITDHRIVFSSSRESFEKRIDFLTTVTPYLNGIDFQFGDKTSTILLPRGDYANLTLKLILSPHP